MKKIFSIALSALLLAGAVDAYAQNDLGRTLPEPQPSAITAAEVDSVSYMMGLTFGNTLRQSASELGALDYAGILRGMKDAMDNGREISQQEFYECLESFVRKRREAAAVANVVSSEKFFAANAKVKGVVTLPSGLQYQIIDEGGEKHPTLDDSVLLDYEGYCILSGELFDSTAERGTSAFFSLGTIIDGLKEGLQLIGEGGEINLWVPAELAYGVAGVPRLIGPMEPLMFHVVLHNVLPSSFEWSQKTVIRTNEDGQVEKTVKTKLNEIK